jgi:hypothetical protein
MGNETLMHRRLNASEEVVFGELGKNFSEIGKRGRGEAGKLRFLIEADQNVCFINAKITSKEKQCKSADLGEAIWKCRVWDSAAWE